MRLHLTLAACLFSGLLSCHGEDSGALSGSGELAVVGGRTIRLPAPVEFERIDGLNPSDDRAVGEMLPATNRYLARYQPAKTNTAGQGRSFNAQVLRAAESREIGNRTFGQMKQQTKGEIEQAQETLRRELSKATGKEAKASKNATVAEALGVSDVAVLGSFTESPNSLGFTIAMNVAEKADDPTTKAKVVVASMIVPANGRLIYLYANADFKSEADRKWAEQAVTAWRDAVLAVNPSVEGPDASSSIFDGIGGSALIGAVIGGVVALMMMLLKKKKT